MIVHRYNAPYICNGGCYYLTQQFMSKSILTNGKISARNILILGQSHKTFDAIFVCDNPLKIYCSSKAIWFLSFRGKLQVDSTCCVPKSLQPLDDIFVLSYISRQTYKSPGYSVCVSIFPIICFMIDVIYQNPLFSFCSCTTTISFQILQHS